MASNFLSRSPAGARTMPEDHFFDTVPNQEEWVSVNEEDIDDRIAQLQELEAELLAAPTGDESELCC